MMKIPSDINKEKLKSLLQDYILPIVASLWLKNSNIFPASNNQRANFRVEYECIQNQRLYLTNVMRTWRQIMIGGALALIPLTAYASINFKGYGLLLWGEGVTFGLIILFIWMYIDSQLDRDILQLYPKIIQLEETLGLSFYSTYIIQNLRESKRTKHIVGQINRAFKQDEIDYDGLLQLFSISQDMPWEVVGSRGRNRHWLIVVAYFLLGIIGFVVIANTLYPSPPSPTVF